MCYVEKMWLAAIVLLVGLQLNLTGAAKILGIFPFQSRSHLIMGSALMKELANRGHQVTMISHFPEKEKIDNYKDIYVKTTMMDITGSQGHANRFLEGNSFGFKEKITMMFTMLQLNTATCDMMLQEEEINKLIHDDKEQFDLIIMEAFVNDCFLGFVHKFKAPLVQACTFGGAPYMDDWFGNPHPFSYVPNSLTSYSDRMNFWERTVNTFIGTALRLIRNCLYLPAIEEVVKKNFGFLEDLPSVNELEQKISVLFLNHHFSISQPRPLVPGIVEVGGLHIKPPKKLPKDLQTFLDDAPDGVVYFSLGSNLQSTNLPDSKRNALLEAFSQLKQKVLWKWENDTLPGQPPNVRLGKWLPQTDILAHPNVRVFITHGGLLSTLEALHIGVPIIGIPIFGDQISNTRKAEAAGFGFFVDFFNLTTESVKSAVMEVLDNPRYRENAQRLSRIFRDQPLTPLDQAVYWTEYVIRHKGAPHMRSAALDLTWYQYLLIDVIAVLTLCLCTVFLLVFFMFRFLLRLCCGGRKQKSEVSPKKKKN